MTTIPERIALAVQALQHQRGDELERFESKFGDPDHTADIKKQLWWDEPAFWNPCITPRQELENLRARRKAYEEAIAWVLAQPPF